MSTTTVDHKEIRKWAESHGGKPAAVDKTHEGKDVGIIRLMFPDSKQSEHDHLVEIEWEEFFEKFEESKLALIYDPKTQFNKLIGRESAGSHDHASHRKGDKADGDHDAKASHKKH